MLYTSQPEADAEPTVNASKQAVRGVKVERPGNGATQLMNVPHPEIAAG